MRRIMGHWLKEWLCNGDRSCFAPKCMFSAIFFVAFSQKKILLKRLDTVSKMQVIPWFSCKKLSTFYTLKTVDNSVENVEMLSIRREFSTQPPLNRIIIPLSPLNSVENSVKFVEKDLITVNFGTHLRQPFCRAVLQRSLRALNTLSYTIAKIAVL